MTEDKALEKALQVICEKCGVDAEPIGIGSASGRLYFRCPKCNVQLVGKNPAAVALGAAGGRKTAENATPEERSRRAKNAVSARWEKKKRGI